MKVQNMLSPRTGNAVANQFEIYDDQGNKWFQSYSAMIAKRTKTGKIYLDKRYWDYSVTTGKYRNKFLRESIAETRDKIASGEYKLVDLNK